MDKFVNVAEIGPRDGFQSISCMMIPTETKLEVIEAIIDAGVSHLQCTSFVSPKAIAQMQDATEIVQTLLEKHPDLDLFALVPNFRGAQSAVAAGLKKVSSVISLSVSHNMNNVRRTHEQSFDELKRIMDTFPELHIELDVATAFGCPFEGEMTIPALVDFVGKAYDLGIRSFNICDTIGVAYPSQVSASFQALMAAYPDVHFSVHIHDTRNMGILNSLEAVRCGVDTVQTTLGGLGGCPFAPGASGNTATEDFVYLLEREGYETGIDQKKLLAAAKLEVEKIPGNYSGHHIHIDTEWPDPARCTPEGRA
ncbi:MAG: hydroxymethylglutaryl-CoA lyase [Eubacteriales bacterium]|nr:hydroxymethylglutaryl-CoA lyase [Eubacteriales bacterium]